MYAVTYALCMSTSLMSCLLKVSRSIRCLLFYVWHRHVDVAISTSFYSDMLVSTESFLKDKILLLLYGADHASQMVCVLCIHMDS